MTTPSGFSPILGMARNWRLQAVQRAVMVISGLISVNSNSRPWFFMRTAPHARNYTPSVDPDDSKFAVIAIRALLLADRFQQIKGLMDAQSVLGLFASNPIK